jgi:hypothetical protein
VFEEISAWGSPGILIGIQHSIDTWNVWGIECNIRKKTEFLQTCHAIFINFYPD